MRKPFKKEADNYTLYGAAFGFFFPVIATIIECFDHHGTISLSAIINVHSRIHLLWIINSAPFWLGLFARFGGIRQDKLRDFTDHLEEIVKERTRELEDAKMMQHKLNDNLIKSLKTEKNMQKDLKIAVDEAKKANTAKSDFLAHMSHDLRTPMNGILGFLTLLEDSELSEEQKKHTAEVRASSNYLLTLINDILDFSKIEAGKLKLESISFNIRSTIEDTVVSLAPVAQQKGLEISVLTKPGIPESVIGDPSRFRQILINLVGNAVKFTEEGEVTIEAEKTNETESNVTIRIRVSDTGIGIANENINRLFARFAQEDSSINRKYGGTGLGLSICKNLAEMMNGGIEVESEKGKGSVFSFYITLGIGKTEEIKTDLQDISGKKILIIDNKKTNRNVICGYLNEFGCSALEAADYEKAMDILKEEIVDLVIVDYHVHEHEAEGQEIAKKLKSRSCPESIPLICITSLGRIGDARNKKEAGFSGYLTNPVKRDDLRGCIALVLRSEHKDEIITKHTVREALPTENPSILLVEDNKTNQKLASIMLKKAGYSVEIAPNGKEAVKAVKSATYQLILMDLQMPVMNLNFAVDTGKFL